MAAIEMKRATTAAPLARGALALLALGVVFGDLGTSPLYALQAAFTGGDAVQATHSNVIGLVSLFLWSLILMVSTKYVLVLMRCDNRGEGGLLALLALLVGEGVSRVSNKRSRRWVYLAMIGTAMLYGDGVITPAISVLSAIEGIEVATPALHSYVVPLTVVILLALFAIQPLGSGRVGVAFGPILASWFVVIFILGLVSLWQTPQIFLALNPLQGLNFFARNGWHGFLALGSVVLCLTGGEALYADMGHFGAAPIRLAWYGMALPALAANYLGQGALLLRTPAAAVRPFYSMVPTWGLYPMVILATLATIVAAQALISAVFSLTHQGSQLGLAPRFTVKHTSTTTAGQIYLPGLNWILMLATIAVVLGFRSSDSLSAAYGLAVSTTMAITTVLFAAYARQKMRWPIWQVALVAGSFLTADIAFVSANAMKFLDGGWLPFSIGTAIFIATLAWFTGLRVLRHSRRESGLHLTEFLASLALHPPYRVHGTAVFVTTPSKFVPVILLHHLKHNQVLHEHVVLLSIVNDETPRIDDTRRAIVAQFELGFVTIEAHFGYMEQPHVAHLLQQVSQQHGCALSDPMSTSFYLGDDVLIPPQHGNIFMRLLMRLFIWMRKNQLDATSHFGIPPNRVVEFGARVDLLLGQELPNDDDGEDGEDGEDGI